MLKGLHKSDNSLSEIQEVFLTVTSGKNKMLCFKDTGMTKI